MGGLKTERFAILLDRVGIAWWCTQIRATMNILEVVLQLFVFFFSVPVSFHYKNAIQVHFRPKVSIIFVREKSSNALNPR